jgi:hypothetical protein
MEQSAIQPSPDQVQFAHRLMVLENQMKSGLNTFYWVAGLSMVNTVAFLTGGGISFVIGLASTQFIDALAHALATDLGSSAGTIISIVGVVIDLFIVGLFCLFGYMGRKRYGKVVILGITLYVLDAGLEILFQDWFAVLFHVLMLVSLVKGYRAINTLKKLEEAYATGGLDATREEIKILPTQRSLEDLRDKYRPFR